MLKMVEVILMAP